MVIELIEKIMKEHNIFSYEYNREDNYLSLSDSIMVSSYSKQLELIKLTNAFISYNIKHKVDSEYKIKILD